MTHQIEFPLPGRCEYCGGSHDVQLAVLNGYRLALCAVCRVNLGLDEAEESE